MHGISSDRTEANSNIMFETVHLILVVSSLFQAAALCTAAVLRAIGLIVFVKFQASFNPHHRWTNDEAMLLLFCKDWRGAVRYISQA